MIIFIVSHPGHDPENVILSATDREDAKRLSQVFLEGDKEHYVVEPITKHGEKTVVILPREVIRIDG